MEMSIVGVHFLNKKSIVLLAGWEILIYTMGFFLFNNLVLIEIILIEILIYVLWWILGFKKQGIDTYNPICMNASFAYICVKSQKWLRLSEFVE
jgi:hypothetical protein